MDLNKPGSFSKALITDIPLDPTSLSFRTYSNLYDVFPDQAIYIYSFIERRMLYAKGWGELLGFQDQEINMIQLVDLTSIKYRDFTNDINDKALRFLTLKTNNLTDYSITIELEKENVHGDNVPLFWRLAVHKEIDGKVAEIIGYAQRINSMCLGEVMNYAAYGPEKSDFEETLSEELFHHFAISKKEKYALTLASQGMTFKEIAHHCNVSQSAIEKRILPLYKRFNCKSLPHLVSFAYRNRILV